MQQPRNTGSLGAQDSGMMLRQSIHNHIKAVQIFREDEEKDTLIKITYILSHVKKRRTV